MKTNKAFKIISFILVVTLLLSTNVAFAANTANGGWKITTKTITDGDYTTTTEIMKKSETGSSEKRINKYVVNNLTKETVIYATNEYDIDKSGIEIVLDTKKTNVNTSEESQTSGTIEATYDVTQFIENNKEASLVMEVKQDKTKKLFDSLMAMNQNLSDNAVIAPTITFESQLENVETLTFKIPRKILEKTYKEIKGSFKMKSNFGFVTFDNKALGEILNGAKENVVITLNKIESEENSGLRVTVNNGKQVTELNGGQSEIGVTYEGSYGLDASRIDLACTDNFGKDITFNEGIQYNDDTHMITFAGGGIGEYSITIAPVTFEDTGMHWAKASIDRWSNLGVINGYNGKFSPNANIKRGDMAVIVGRITNEIPQKVERPKEYITREDAAVMICKAFGFSKSQSSKTAFNDEANISAEAKAYLYNLSNKGYMSGYKGNLNPKSPITRAETVTMFNNIVTELVNYGTYSKNVNGNLLINGEDTTLKDMTVNGDLIISDGVGDGDITLDNVIVTGKLIARGGGTDSIHVNGSSKLTSVELKRDTGAVRLVAEQSSEIDSVTVASGLDNVILEGNLSNVDVASNVPVKLNNLKLDNLEVSTTDAKITIDSMSHIEKAEIKEIAKSAKLDISGEVKEINVKGQNAKIEGSGCVDTVVASANNVNIKTNGTEVKVGADIVGTIAGKDGVAAGENTLTPGKKPGVGSNGKVSESVSPYAPTIKTTIKDGKTVKGSKMTFDLWATTPKGEKISSSNCKVTLNNTEVKKNWEDTDKTSYTLAFEEGNNEIVITATSDGETTKKTYSITYKPSNDGTVGEAIVAIELFSIGGDYLIAPTKVDIIEGENAAMMLDRLLSDYGYSYTKTGELKKGFYLASITGGDITDTDIVPINMDKAPEYLRSAINSSGFEKGVDDPWIREDVKSLGEFDYTHGSGWMYAVNNVFPNVGFADTYLQDGDVMRIQFTVAYGADIGGSSAMGDEKFGSAFWSTANKDAVTKKYADREMPSKVLEIMKKLNATQSEVDSKK